MRRLEVWGSVGENRIKNWTGVFFSADLCALIVPTTEKIEEIYRAFVKESGIQFSELEGQVLQFHLSNLEYACGSSLHQVSRRVRDTLWLAAAELPRSGKS